MNSDQKIEIVETIKSYLVKVEVLNIPEDYKKVIIDQFSFLVDLSKDDHDYDNLSFIMDYRFLVETQMIIMSIDKLAPEIKQLALALQAILNRKQIALLSN